jgi:hypothetical protein
MHTYSTYIPTVHTYIPEQKSDRQISKALLDEFLIHTYIQYMHAYSDMHTYSTYIPTVHTYIPGKMSNQGNF